MPAGWVSPGRYSISAQHSTITPVGSMSGFDRKNEDAALFAGTSWKPNFLCTVGYGDAAALFDRLPRRERPDVLQILWRG